MHLAQLRLDPQVKQLLGTHAVSQLAAMLNGEVGECVTCHNRFGTAPVGITVHRSAGTDAALHVLPAHDACHPSELFTHPPGLLPFAPTPTYYAFAFTIPMPSRNRRWLPWRRGASAAGLMPTVLINPSVDVQTGHVVDGQWRGAWENDLAPYGLRAADQMDIAGSSDPTWRAWQADDGQLVLSNPRSLHRVPARAEHQALVMRRGRCLVLVSDYVRPSPGTDKHQAVEVSDVVAAIEANRAYAAWAGLENSSQPPREPVAQTSAERLLGIALRPGTGAALTSAELHALTGTPVVQARASFTDHPAVGVGRPTAVEGTGATPEHAAGRIPVLLVQPSRPVVLSRSEHGTVREAHAEAAIAAGMRRALPGDVTTLPAARGWQVQARSGQVQLAGPGQVSYGQAQLRYPPSWAEAADKLGQVLVVFGTQIGVRSPTGTPYNDDDRRTELEAARHSGAVAWGLATWHRGHP